MIFFVLLVLEGRWQAIRFEFLELVREIGRPFFVALRPRRIDLGKLGGNDLGHCDRPPRPEPDVRIVFAGLVEGAVGVEVAFAGEQHFLVLLRQRRADIEDRQRLSAIAQHRFREAVVERQAVVDVEVRLGDFQRVGREPLIIVRPFQRQHAQNISALAGDRVRDAVKRRKGDEHLFLIRRGPRPEIGDRSATDKEQGQRQKSNQENEIKPCIGALRLFYEVIPDGILIRWR